ncbi:ADP-ribosylation factor-like protein 2 [Malassezia restricta]|uniref:ADP-ribosylation factor-like protein 2 n=1 Tax=Malassezia restricta TaxID=76775 RepID=UPI000DD12D7B|nr:ADP-ribosylation factor-like protein 2 [Malassezia restricta]AXA50455.1 ADP-ribosylation factor-like protein 2 [Malassezia restricta]
MGLLSILQKNKYKDRELRILFLGLDNAGKTTTLKQLLGEPLDTISPTFGFSIRTLVRHSFTLNIWDVGGQRTLRPYWRNYFEKTDGVVWVVDSGDVTRMHDCRMELWNLLGEERLASASILILANKQDVPGALASDDIRKLLKLDDIQTHAWRIQPTSAYTGENVNGALDWLLEDIRERLYYY